MLTSFPGSPEHEINTRGVPGIFSLVIKIGPEFSEQKGNVLCVIQPALRSTLGVYDISRSGAEEPGNEATICNISSSYIVSFPDHFKHDLGMGLVPSWHLLHLFSM